MNYMFEVKKQNKKTIQVHFSYFLLSVYDTWALHA